MDVTDREALYKIVIARDRRYDGRFGYRSIRRFNEAFKERFREAPSTLRKSGGAHRSSDFITVELPVVAPYDWTHIYGFLRAHAQIGIESFVESPPGGLYRRNITLEGKYRGAFELRLDEGRSQLVARIAMADSARFRRVIERIRDLFDARLNPHIHLDALIPDDSVADVYRENLGIRIPGAWDSYETAVCIILGQLVSVEQAQKKVAKLIALFGTKVAHPHFAECSRLFPRPEVLAQASLREVGLTRTRERAIQQLSRLVHERKIDLSRTADIEKTRAELLSIPGIGPWTVEMIAMRCLGDANAFPKTDLIVKRAIEHHNSEKGDWSPWNAYIALTLWKKYALILSKKGKARPPKKASFSKVRSAPSR